MPLLPIADQPSLHLAAEVGEERPQPIQPSAPGPLHEPGPLRGVLRDTQRSWPLVLFHLLVLGGAVGYAATASAQPVDAAGVVSPEAIQAVAGDPWATVVVALLFVGGQLVAAWRDWSKVRGSDLEKALARVERLEAEAVVAAKEIARLEARAELAQLREGDARAAVSGVVARGDSAG